MRFFGRSRSQLTERVPPGGLHDYLATPLPDPATPLDEVGLLAVDIETSGLDPAKDQLLSAGFVPVDGEAIRLAGAGQVLVQPSREVGDSVRFHGLTDDALAPGVALAEALDAVFGALAGRVLLAHHAAIETGFLGRACEVVHGMRPPFTVVDTMSLQFALLSQGFDDEPPQGSLRLWAARGQYGLPRYAGARCPHRRAGLRGALPRPGRGVAGDETTDAEVGADGEVRAEGLTERHRWLGGTLSAEGVLCGGAAGRHDPRSLQAWVRSAPPDAEPVRRPVVQGCAAGRRYHPRANAAWLAVTANLNLGTALVAVVAVG